MGIVWEKASRSNTTKFLRHYLLHSDKKQKPYYFYTEYLLYSSHLLVPNTVITQQYIVRLVGKPTNTKCVQFGRATNWRIAFIKNGMNWSDVTTYEIFFAATIVYQITQGKLLAKQNIQKKQTFVKLPAIVIVSCFWYKTYFNCILNFTIQSWRLAAKKYWTIQNAIRLMTPRALTTIRKEVLALQKWQSSETK